MRQARADPCDVWVLLREIQLERDYKAEHVRSGGERRLARTDESGGGGAVGPGV